MLQLQQKPSHKQQPRELSCVGEDFSWHENSSSDPWPDFQPKLHFILFKHLAPYQGNSILVAFREQRFFFHQNSQISS